MDSWMLSKYFPLINKKSASRINKLDQVSFKISNYRHIHKRAVKLQVYVAVALFLCVNSIRINQAEFEPWISVKLKNSVWSNFKT